MRLVDRLRGGRGEGESRYSVDEYLAAANEIAYGGIGLTNGITQTLTGNSVEAAAPTLTGHAGSMSTNDVVFSCMLNRQMVFSAVLFRWQQVLDGAPSKMFGTSELRLLERPWRGGTTQDLTARMIQDADLAGNAFVARDGSELVRLRPDWVEIVAEPRRLNGGRVGLHKLGFVYTEGGAGSGATPVPFLLDEVAHFAPIPDPLATFRGMSWLTPVARSVQADRTMLAHRQAFFANGATPNMIVKHDAQANQEKILDFAAKLEARHGGVRNAYRTLHLYPGADATVVGRDFQQLDFRAVQGAGETRIAAAAGVPPVIVGLSEGLAAATYCLPADELVWTLAGPRPIAEVKPGERVWSYGDGTLRPQAVTWQGQVGVKAVYTIRTKNRVLRATGNHPVLARKAGTMGGGSNAERRVGVQWMRVEDLRPGDRVVQVMGMPEAGGDVPDGVTLRHMQWLGAYLGDGCGAGKGRQAISISMPPKDRCRDHYEALTRELFGAHIGHEPRSFRFHSVVVSEWLGGLGMAGTAKTKTVPGWVFTAPLEYRLAFLGGLTDSDGHVDKTGHMTVQLSNRPLVEQVKALAVSCGMQVSNLRHVRMPASGLPNPGIHEWYDAWTVTISHAQPLRPFTADPVYDARLAGDGRKERRGGLDAAKAGLDPDLLGFFTVRSIEVGDPEPVYDLTVEGDHSFVASGVVVHNSNYGQARRRFADGTIHPLWMNAAGSLETLLVKPGGSVRLWYDATNVPFLREDESDAATIQQTQAVTIKQLIDAGYTPDSVVDAVGASDFRRLVHTGLFSVQLQAPGSAQATDTGVVNGAA